VSAVAELALPASKLDDEAVNVAVSEITEIEVLFERGLERAAKEETERNRYGQS